MDISTESERIIRLKEVISIERGLLEAGFVTDPHTGLLYRGLRIDACED